MRFYGVQMIFVALAAVIVASCAPGWAETFGGGYAPATSLNIPGTPPSPDCRNIADLTSVVASKFGERTAYGAILGERQAVESNGWAVVVFASQGGRTWTLASVQPDGTACIQAYGVDWTPAGPLDEPAGDG